MLERREFLKTLGAGALAAWSRRAWAQPAGARPNLLVIQTDEHNFRTLGCYRALLPPEEAFVWGPGVAVETPNLDSIARAGAICTRTYAASPVCSPSRASFVSGRYPQHTGIVTNDQPMNDDVVTYAEVLRRAGYATGYAGKWHIDGPARPGWAPARHFGFDDNHYMFNRGHWKQLEDTPQGPQVKARDAKGVPTYNVQGADEKSFTTDFLADRAVAFINAHKEQPFCYQLSIPDPHGPNTVRPPYDTQFVGLRFRVPRTATEPGDAMQGWARPLPGAGKGHPMPEYFGMVKCIDDNVGKILAALRANGLMERTIVVFTSDHGDMCGEHGRVNKGIPLEGSARIPFLIACPGRIQPGTVIPQALSTVDFNPTILSLMGQAADRNVDGRDASSLFLNGRAPAGWQDVVCVRHAGNQWLMAASAAHKLVLSAADDPCLFDLQKDALETRNLFAEAGQREKVRELARSLLEYARKEDEPMLQDAGIRADLTWCAEGTGAYTAPKRVPAGRGRRGQAGGGEDG